MKTITINYWKIWSNGLIPITMAIIEENAQIPSTVGVFYRSNAGIDRVIKYARSLESNGYKVYINESRAYLSRVHLRDILDNYRDLGVKIRRKADLFHEDVIQENLF